ncbi:CLUMA_CG015909, isoform A [Clunio marinus]|uniref:CLUMA_CG015909, isoform A n=1 Tax=Clunio marinus TaxID=568069 RepID=A0A1J1IR17_9DIPT|nr:CLUMA_CG015909, isoform A [Clunio marinus]
MEHKNKSLFFAEDLSDIFLRVRPELKNVFPQAFQPVEAGSIIEISGYSGSGKSCFTLDLIASTLISNLEANNPKVLLIDTDKSLNIIKLCEICNDKLTTESGSPTDLRDHIERLQIMTCDRLNFSSIFSKLEAILTDDPQISLIILDNLGVFYYFQSSMNLEETSTVTKKENYIASYLKKFNLLCEKFKVTFVYVKPHYIMNHREIRENFTTHSVTLEKIDGETFSMDIRQKEEFKGKYFYSVASNGLKFKECDDN